MRLLLPAQSQESVADERLVLSCQGVESAPRPPLAVLNARRGEDVFVDQVLPTLIPSFNQVL